ncbi:MAG: C39 family peptidase [bacterium]
MKIFLLSIILLLLSLLFVLYYTKSYTPNIVSSVDNSELSTSSLAISQTVSSIEVELEMQSSSSTYSFECKNSELSEFEQNGIQYCRLNVPYFNQVLNSSGVETLDPSGLGRVSYMCTAAASVMIMGYYNRLTYTTTDELREHMYKSLSVDGLKKGNTVKVNGTNIKLCMDGAFALTSYDPLNGKSNCNWNSNVNVYFNYLGYKLFNVSSKFDDIVKEIDKGRPILFAIAPVDQIANKVESHYVVVKGYSVTEGKKILLLNDPDRDLNKLNDQGKCAGLSFPPSLDGENSIFDFNSHKCTQINNFYSIYK